MLSSPLPDTAHSRFFCTLPTAAPLRLLQHWRCRHYHVDYPMRRSASIIVIDSHESPFTHRTFPDDRLCSIVESRSLDQFLSGIADRIDGNTLRGSTVWCSDPAEHLFQIIKAVVYTKGLPASPPSAFAALTAPHG